METASRGHCTIGVSLRRWLAGRTRGARALPPALLGQYGADVNGLSDVFPPRLGQVGVISAVGQDLFLELFGDPEIFEDRYDQVLKSALVEAVAHPTAVVTPTDHAQGMLGDLVLTSKDSKVVQSRSLQDSGRSLVFLPAAFPAQPSFREAGPCTCPPTNVAGGTAAPSTSRLPHLVSHKCGRHRGDRRATRPALLHALCYAPPPLNRRSGSRSLRSPAPLTLLVFRLGQCPLDALRRWYSPLTLAARCSWPAPRWRRRAPAVRGRWR